MERLRLVAHHLHSKWVIILNDNAREFAGVYFNDLLQAR